MSEYSLIDAVENGNLQDVRFLLAQGEPVNQRDSSNMTPLMYAAKYVNFDIIRELISAGASLEDQDRYGETPLMLVIGELLRELIPVCSLVMKMNSIIIK